MKLSTQIFLGFFIAISIDLLDTYVNYSLTLKVKTNSDFLTTSEAIIRNSGQLSKGIVDMQSAFRGYLLTNDENFLYPYYDGLKTIPILLHQEDQLIDSSSPQQHKLDSIIFLHKLWVNYANQIIKAKKKALVDPKQAKPYQYLMENKFKTQTGKIYNDAIAKVFRSLDQFEYRVREGRREALAGSIKQTESFSILFSTLLIIFGSVAALFLVKRMSSRIDSMVRLAENISQGDFTKVSDNKNDELSSLSVSLNSMSDILSRNINELEKRNGELNQFAYVVSHDLKAPVRGIYNVTQWIEQDLDDEVSPKMRTYLDIIPERIERMENLIDGLLDYARVSRVKQVKEETDVLVMINEIAEVIVPKEYQLITKNLPKFSTEKLLLQQVFSNLISNAVKYTQAKNGKITISCIEKEIFYEFCVTDEGVGIEEEYHERIFEIFQTLREKHDKESTGIGLAIVKKIIEDKHCVVKVNSAKGRGASFTFTWPKD
jgi:signal transduction histidine kinase